MNENMVDILIYLYENYMDTEQPTPPDQAKLHEELAQAGFPENIIKKTFQWLDELAWRQGASDYRPHTKKSIRVFTERESRRLDTDCQGLLLFLEQNGIMDQLSRELVIERALALDSAHITVDELKWIVLLVLMNQPGQESAVARMEDLVYNEAPLHLH